MSSMRRECKNGSKTSASFVTENVHLHFGNSTSTLEIFPAFARNCRQLNTTLIRSCFTFPQSGQKVSAAVGLHSFAQRLVGFQDASFEPFSAAHVSSFFTSLLKPNFQFSVELDAAPELLGAVEGLGLNVGFHCVYIDCWYLVMCALIAS